MAFRIMVLGLGSNFDHFIANIKHHEILNYGF